MWDLKFDAKKQNQMYLFSFKTSKRGAIGYFPFRYRRLAQKTKIYPLFWGCTITFFAPSVTNISHLYRYQSSFSKIPCWWLRCVCRAVWIRNVLYQHRHARRTSIGADLSGAQRRDVRSQRDHETRPFLNLAAGEANSALNNTTSGLELGALALNRITWSDCGAWKRNEQLES